VAQTIDSSISPPHLANGHVTAQVKEE